MRTSGTWLRRLFVLGTACGLAAPTAAAAVTLSAGGAAMAPAAISTPGPAVSVELNGPLVPVKPAAVKLKPGAKAKEKSKPKPAARKPAAPVKASKNWSLGDRLPLALGAKGHDVRVLQDLLTRVGQVTAVDGVFGAGTKAAVLAFEQVQRLPVDGIVTAQLIKVLRDVATQGSAVASISSETGGALVPTDAELDAVGPGVVATLAPGGLAVAPAGAPPVVQAIIAAGNRIATMPYIYGGGHGSWTDSGYDCSGSVSFALHGGGLLASPLDSTSFEHWGAAGPGQWVTIYANAAHAYMVVAGLRFDTSGQSGAGTRWQANMVSGSGFVVRHPVGL